MLGKDGEPCRSPRSASSTRCSLSKWTARPRSKPRNSTGTTGSREPTGKAGGCRCASCWYRRRISPRCSQRLAPGWNSAEAGRDRRRSGRRDLPAARGRWRLARISASSRLLWPAAVCCAALGAGRCGNTLCTPRDRSCVSRPTRWRPAAAAAAEADSLRQEIDRLSGSADFIESERDKAGRPLVVLAAATRVLPDDTYLTEMELRQRKVTLTGRSAAAARLIGPLAADGTFRNPGFAAPVTRLEALHTELFTINAEVGP